MLLKDQMRLECDNWNILESTRPFDNVTSTCLVRFSQPCPLPRSERGCFDSAPVFWNSEVCPLVPFGLFFLLWSEKSFAHRLENVLWQFCGYFIVPEAAFLYDGQLACLKSPISATDHIYRGNVCLLYDIAFIGHLCTVYIRTGHSLQQVWLLASFERHDCCDIVPRSFGKRDGWLCRMWAL